ncbi:MAG: response regulator, partial [Deltaproteobacteria bacterium]|nr:response regulator [Deltaproteobacteria bacterium]
MTDRDNNKRGSVIFVDDEPRVLEGLKRMLRAESRSYDFAFAAGGNEALDLMQKNKFDLVVTDMKMPGMNGVQLLGEVKRYYPDTIRIILSGEIELEMRMRSVNISHQFLTKPCDSMTLKSAITRTCEISRMFNSVPLKRALTAMQTLPSLPSIN